MPKSRDDSRIPRKLPMYRTKRIIKQSVVLLMIIVGNADVIAKTPEDVGNIAKIATMLGSPMRDASDKIQDFTMLLANNSIRRLDQFRHTGRVSDQYGGLRAGRLQVQRFHPRGRALGHRDRHRRLPDHPAVLAALGRT